jgi:anti-sigma-K factor RskA
MKTAGTHWRDSPRALEHLAAAYALGTLAGPARRRFEAVMRTHPPAARAVHEWNRRFAPLAERLPPQPPSEALWARIEQRSFGGASTAAGAAAGTAPRAGWRRWLDALLAPATAGALAAGLALGLVLPSIGPMLASDAQRTELPESYVGVLATAEGRTGMIVSSLRRGRVVDLKRVAEVPVPEGRTLHLWVIDAAGRTTPVGPVPAGPFVRVTLPREAEEVFSRATELALSIEPAGSSPAAPTLPYAYRGLCGKLWRVTPPAPAASR